MKTLESIYGIGDVLEKMFILEHKIVIKKQKNEDCAAEQTELSGIKEYVNQYKIGLADLISGLFSAHHQIWERESELRQGKDMSDEDAGRLAKEIRVINDTLRIPFRNKINELTNTGIVEQKVI